LQEKASKKLQLKRSHAAQDNPKDNPCGTVKGALKKSWGSNNAQSMSPIPRLFFSSPHMFNFMLTKLFLLELPAEVGVAPGSTAISRPLWSLRVWFFFPSALQSKN